MPSGKRWKVEIDWIDNEGIPATTTYWDDNTDSPLLLVAESVSRLVKNTNKIRVVGVVLHMNCFTCGYDSNAISNYGYIPNKCDCNKGISE
jgi:hypothetical protein